MFMFLDFVRRCCVHLIAVTESLQVRDSKQQNTHFLSKLKEQFKMDTQESLERKTRLNMIGGADWRDFINSIINSSIGNSNSGMVKNKPSLGQTIAGQQWRRYFDDKETSKRRLKRGSYSKIISMAKTLFNQKGTSFKMPNIDRGGYTALRMTFGK